MYTNCKLLWRNMVGVGFLRSTQSSVNSRFASTTIEDKKSTELYSIQADEDLEMQLMEKEAEIERKRNKSKLMPQHYNILHGNVPYDEPKCEIHFSLKYKKRMFGRYGYESGVNPGALWPSADEIKEIYEYEKVAYPYTVQEMWEQVRQQKETEEKIINERQENIANNLKKLNQWKKEMSDRAEKKLQATAAAKAKKDALIEEVRRHFGYKVDPKDERFKEMLIQKERDQKKKLKLERAKAKQEKLLAKLESNRL